MTTDDLPLPKLLVELIARGQWIGRANLGKAIARRISPDDDQLVLCAPPFHSIADEVKGGNSWWITGLTNVGEIEYERALIIADFGIGSDSTIILYYDPPRTPMVMYLKWAVVQREARQSWEQTHRCFADFAAEIGLLGGRDE